MCLVCLLIMYDQFYPLFTHGKMEIPSFFLVEDSMVVHQKRRTHCIQKKQIFIPLQVITNNEAPLKQKYPVYALLQKFPVASTFLNLPHVVLCL